MYHFFCLFYGYLSSKSNIRIFLLFFRRISHIRGMPFVAVALTILRCKNTQRAFAKAIADQKAGGTPPRTPSIFFIISQCLVQSQIFYAYFFNASHKIHHFYPEHKKNPCNCLNCRVLKIPMNNHLFFFGRFNCSIIVFVNFSTLIQTFKQTDQVSGSANGKPYG